MYNLKTSTSILTKCFKGGIGDDHNAHRPEDVVERLRLGLMLTIKSRSMNSNLGAVFSKKEGALQGRSTAHQLLRRR